MEVSFLILYSFLFIHLFLKLLNCEGAGDTSEGDDPAREPGLGVAKVADAVGPSGGSRGNLPDLIDTNKEVGVHERES